MRRKRIEPTYLACIQPLRLCASSSARGPASGRVCRRRCASVVHLQVKCAEACGGGEPILVLRPRLHGRGTRTASGEARPLCMCESAVEAVRRRCAR